MKRKLTENPIRPGGPVGKPLPVIEECVLECCLVDGTWAEWARITLHSGAMWDGERLAAFRPKCRVRFLKTKGKK